MKYWLVKSEPYKYSWNDFVQEGRTYWDGVRNYQARNNLKDMCIGDKAFFYHSGEGLEIVGIASVVKAFYQDPTTDDARWCAVDLEPMEALKKPVSLKQIKSDSRIANINLVRQGRLSVVSISSEEFAIIISMSHE